MSRSRSVSQGSLRTLIRTGSRRDPQSQKEVDSPLLNEKSDVPEDLPIVYSLDSSDDEQCSGSSHTVLPLQTKTHVNTDTKGIFVEIKKNINLKFDPLIVSPLVETLVVGDSNLRDFDPAPLGWMVCCLPGLRISLLTQLLKLSKIPPNIKHIIISVGINDRDSESSVSLIECLKVARGEGRTVHFQTIVFSKTLLPNQKLLLTKLNKTARDLDWVKTIPSDLKEPTFKDFLTQNIHYDKETSAHIFNNMMSHINSLNSK